MDQNTPVPSDPRMKSSTDQKDGAAPRPKRKRIHPLPVNIAHEQGMIDTKEEQENTGPTPEKDKTPTP